MARRPRWRARGRDGHRQPRKEIEDRGSRYSHVGLPSGARSGVAERSVRRAIAELAPSERPLNSLDGGDAHVAEKPSCGAHGEDDPDKDRRDSLGLLHG